MNSLCTHVKLRCFIIRNFKNIVVKVSYSIQPNDRSSSSRERLSCALLRFLLLILLLLVLLFSHSFSVSTIIRSIRNKITLYVRTIGNNQWYNKRWCDFSQEDKLEIRNKIFSYKAHLSGKLNLEIHEVQVHSTNSSLK